MPPKTEKVVCTCVICGIEFLRYPSTVGNYCSMACVGKSKRNGSTLYCALCDAPFYRRFGEQDLGERENQFCSKDCYSDWRQINSKDSTYPKIKGRHAHRIIAEEHMGRELITGEVVHHVDLNKKNNSPSNLAVFPNQSIHARCHFGEMSSEELRGYCLVK